MKHFQLFINNQWIDAESGQTFKSVNPANKQYVAELSAASAKDVEKACTAARNAFESDVWSELGGDKRAEYMLKVAAIMKRRAREFAEYEAMETGKPISETINVDIPYSIWAFEYFANLAREVRGEVIPINGNPGRNIFNYVTHEPYGVVAVISPYNFPLHLMTRSLCPALAAGNTSVCKASATTPSTAALLAEVIEEAGFPVGVVNVIHGLGSVCGEALASNREVDIIAFTGSVEVGRKLMHYSADSPVMKKTLLELGGKGPSIVEPDCDMELATNAQLEGFTFNQGEVCCAMTRLLIHEDIYHEFLALLVKKANALKMGDTLDETTQLGSLISDKHLETVDRYVQEAVAAGAKVVCGGERYTAPPCDQGSYYKPTILVDVEPSMKCFREEIFGPVLVVKKYKTLEEAIALANDTDFGLGANIFTQDLKKAYWVARKINAGSIWVNMANGSMMSCPFGGTKNSGLGREYGVVGLHEYLKVKNNMWMMKNDGPTFGGDKL